jgi:hypothetical protein
MKAVALLFHASTQEDELPLGVRPACDLSPIPRSVVTMQVAVHGKVWESLP